MDLNGSIRKCFPVLRWMIFIAAILMILTGVQAMYVALNPPTRSVRGFVFSDDPEISLIGAMSCASGLAVLWFGRQWWSNKRR